MSIYLLYGDEDFLIKEELDALKKKHLDPSDTFALETVDAASATTDQVVNALSATPMLGSGRFLVITDLFKPRSGRKAKEVFDFDRIMNALKNVPPDETVVFYQNGNADGRMKLVKYIAEKGTAKEFKSLAFWEQDKAMEWVVGRVQKNGKKIGAHASEALVNIVGLNLRMLDKEIEKLVTFIGDKQGIDVPDVESVASSGEINVFAFSNSIREKKIDQAMKHLNDLFKDKEAPPVMIGMIARLYRTLLQVKSLERKGMNQYEIAQELGTKPFFVKKHMEKTRLFTAEELKKGLGKLLTADLRIKSGSDPRVILELLVTDLCRQRA